MWKKLLIILLISCAANGEATKKRICVIGAGMSGLVAAKHFSEYSDEFETVVFEKNSDVGGMWIYTDNMTIDEHGFPVHSSVYKNLRTNSAQNVMEFPDYPELGDETTNGRFLKHEVILEYLRNYTEHFNLRRHIKLNANVEKIKPLPRLRWLTVWRNLNNNKTTKTVCDALLVCNGHNYKGNIPKIPGIESFTGQILHSHVYRKPEPFANQTVVVLGASASGTDIAIDVSPLAKKVYLSHRHNKIPGLFLTNLEQVPGVVGAEDGKLILSNGTEISADALIFCTGYVLDYPFLDKSSGIVVKGGKYVYWIYKDLINIERPNMAFVELAENGLHFQLPHAQINYFRALLRGKVILPNRKQMLLEAEKSANASSGKGHIRTFDEFSKRYNYFMLAAGGKPLSWWAVQYTEKREKLFSTDRLHCKDKRWKTLLIFLLISCTVNGLTTRRRVCVSGIVTKCFNEYPDEFETVTFEKNSDVGGLWIYTDSTTIDEHGLPVHSSIYKSLRVNTIKNFTIIHDYPDFGDESSKGRFVKHQEVLEYLRNYTDHLNLRQYIKFNTNVEKIKPLPHMRWFIVTRNLNNNKTNYTTCDAVVVCNGQNVKGYIPKIPGIESFTGKLLHSHVYRKPEPFVNHTVVVLGGGQSGVDISVDISSAARKVYLGHRHEKLLGDFPSNLEQVPGVVAAEDGKIVLSNGTKISADALIFCTGYRYDFAFLDESSGIVTEKGGKYVRPVYKHMINIERPTMAIIALPLRVITFQSIPAQIHYFRAVLRGEVSLPSREQMLLIEAEVPVNGTTGKGHIAFYNNEFLRYYDELVLPIDGKRLPWWVAPYWDEYEKLVFDDPIRFREKRFVIHEDNRTVEFV